MSANDAVTSSIWPLGHFLPLISTLSETSDGRHYRLEVVSGEDITGEYADGKPRETWLPVELEYTGNRYVQNEAIESGEPLIDRTTRSVEFWVGESHGKFHCQVHELTFMASIHTSRPSDTEVMFPTFVD